MRPLVTVETFSAVIDARLAQARLEGAGIRTFLRDELVASIDPFLIGAIGGVKLQVDLDDEAAAREILRQPPDDRPAGDVDRSAPLCPRCDSEYVFGTSRVRCRRCGYKGDASEFVSADRGRAARTAAIPWEDASPPVFRLERRHTFVGGILGLAVGLAVTIFFGRDIGSYGLLVGLVAGASIGRTRKYAVCSKPACRGPLVPGDRVCGRCNGEVRGTITRETDHFVRVAEWERQHRAATSLDS